MVAGAAYLTREPAHAALVGLELRLDDMPDVDVFLCVHDGAKIIRQNLSKSIHFIHLQPQKSYLCRHYATFIRHRTNQAEVGNGF